MHVDGTHIRDSNGNIVVLRSVGYTSYDWYQHAHLNENQFIYMHNLGANSVVIGVTTQSIDGYGCFSDPDFWIALDNIMDWAEAHGLYVILRGMQFWTNCVEHNIPTNYLNHYLTVHHTWAEWVGFFVTYATRYADRTHIIYEPLVESLYCSYSDYQTHMRAVIDAIRAIDSDAIVSVQHESAGDWGCHFLFEQSNPINRSNIIFSCDPYGYQTYPNNDQASIRAFLANDFRSTWMIANGRCVIFSEFGGNLGDFDSWSETYVNNLLTVADTDGYSGYSAWVWAWEVPIGGFHLISTWSGALTPWGVCVRTYYLAHLTNYPPVDGSKSISTTLAGYTCTFTCAWTDDYGLSQGKFSYKIGGGAWTNKTVKAMSGLSYSFSDTLVLPNSSGITVYYRFYAKDTDNLWTMTNTYFLTTTTTMPPPPPPPYVPPPSPPPSYPPPPPPASSGVRTVDPFNLYFIANTELGFQHLSSGGNPAFTVVINVTSGVLNGSNTQLRMDDLSGKLTFKSNDNATLALSATETTVKLMINGHNYTMPTVISPNQNIEIRWSMPAQPLLPWAFILGMLGLAALIGGAMLIIYWLKKKEYYTALAVGTVIMLVGLALFVGWLWS